MTNEEAKQEAIKKAWIDAIGEKEYNRIAFLIDSNGFCTDSGIDEFALIGMTLDSHSVFDKINYRNYDTCNDFRPIALIDLIDNNGWIRIEPDGSNLPEMGVYRVFCDKQSFDCFLYHTGQWIYENLQVSPTHYKLIKAEPKPIY